MKARYRPAVLLVIFLADRITKYWAIHWLRPRFSVAVLPFFHLTYVENTGAAFSIGYRRNGFFTVLTAALIGVLFYLQKVWAQKNPWLRAGLLLVTGGALGNLYDRVAYGCVVDFLDFRIWPIFNVADSCVTVGACCLAWGMRGEK